MDSVGHYSSVNIEKLNGSNDPAEPSLLETIKKFNINMIHTRTLYTKNGNSYLIGEYNPKNDRKDSLSFPEKKYFLIALN